MYSISAYPAGGFTRHNDGSMVIMHGEKYTDDYQAVLLVPRFTPAKRGSAWNTPDPAQEVFAAAVVAALNAVTASVEPPKAP